MPFNPGQYIYQPRPLQQFDFGRGFRDVINATQNRQRIDNQKTQFDQSRSDRQNEFSAEFAQKQGDTRHTAASSRHQNQVALVDAATKAAQAGDWNTARALLPRILELGGEASESGSPDSPVFRFKSGAAPERAPLDFGGARRGIYGQQVPSVSQPFQVPGFGAAGQRNPLDPPALAGSAAAQLQPPSASQTSVPPSTPADAGPPPDTAGPPPGAAIDGPRTPPPGAVWLPPEAESAPAAPTVAPPTSQNGGPQNGATTTEQAAQPGSPQLTGPNPFDPYTIDTAKVTASNRLRLDPMLSGIVSATPQRYRERVQQFTNNLGDLRLGPTATLNAAQPWFEQLAGMYRGEVAAEGAAGRLEQMGAHRESVQYDKDRDRGFRIAKDKVNLDKLGAVKSKLQEAYGVQDLLKSAHRNSASANALIRKLYSMQTSGVMTDKDYEQTKEGVKTIWQAIKDKTVEKLFNPHGGGLTPSVVRDMKELVEIALQGHQRAAMSGRDSLYRAWKANRNEAEREAIAESIRSYLPEEYWPPELAYESGGESVPTHDAEDEEAVMQRLQEEENLGVVPLPDGAPRMPREPNRAGAARGTRVPPKPPRRSPSGKPVEKMSEQELKEEMDKLLE